MPSARLRPALVADDRPLWPQLLAIARQRRALARAGSPAGTPAAATGRETAGSPDPSPEPGRDALLADLVALYEPLLAIAPGRRFVCAHLGQSIDGHIATRDGCSRGLNGAANLDHLHRMRALSDAIVVGAGTVIADDPLLTTRRVTGDHPVRVVLDGQGRVDARHRLCRDATATTLILTARADAPARIGRAEVIRLDRTAQGNLDPGQCFDRLAERGLDVIFVEGGGVTVSRLLRAGRLDRLQLTVAPVLFGGGVRGVAMPGIDRVADGLRPAVRQFPMGPDRLWEFAFAPSADDGGQAARST